MGLHHLLWSLVIFTPAKRETVVSIQGPLVRKQAGSHCLRLASKGRKSSCVRTQIQKMRLLNDLDVPTLEFCHHKIEVVRRSGEKIYIGGILSDLLPTTLPCGSLQWSVHSHLIPYLNPTGNGCRAGPYYTLLHCVWIEKCFPSTDNFFRLFMSLLELHPRVDPRGQKKIPVYDWCTPETFVVVGTSSRRYGRGLQLKGGRRSSKWKDAPLNNFQQVAHAAKAYLDTPSILYLSAVKEMTNCTEFTFDSSPDTVIWPLAAVAANVVMDMHTYKDYIMSCAGVLGGEGKRKHDSEGSNILQYFCFPGTGSAVGLGNGDLLLFNPTVPHCLSSRCTFTKDVICTSFYLKTAIVGGNGYGKLEWAYHPQPLL